MFYKGFFQRIMPFFLTFAAGLFIASFSVPIVAPNFNLPRSRSNRTHECKRVNSELEQLRKDYFKLEEENKQLRRDSVDRELLYEVPPVVEFDVPPPPPPRARRAPRSDK